MFVYDDTCSTTRTPPIGGVFSCCGIDIGVEHARHFVPNTGAHLSVSRRKLVFVRRAKNIAIGKQRRFHQKGKRGHKSALFFLFDEPDMGVEPARVVSTRIGFTFEPQSASSLLVSSKEKNIAKANLRRFHHKKSKGLIQKY